MARITLMSISLIAIVGAISIGLTPKESLGCGGTEFADASEDCPTAQFHMTIDGEDWDPISKKMCFRMFESEARCTVYEYNLVPVNEYTAVGAEPSDQYVDLTHGVGCDENRVEGELEETVDGESVWMSLSGVLTRSPIPVVESTEPLAVGSCSTASKYHAGDFELFVVPSSE